MTLKRNVIVSTLSLLFWTILILVEVKINNYEILKFLFSISLVVIVGGFIWANSEAHPTKSRGFNVTQGIVIAIIFIFLAVVLGVNFKFFIGGSG